MNYDNCEHEYMELKSEFNEDAKFERFIDEVNAKCEARYGLSVADFPDFDFDSVYDESVAENTGGWEHMIKSAFEQFRLDNLRLI